MLNVLNQIKQSNYNLNNSFYRHIPNSKKLNITVLEKFGKHLHDTSKAKQSVTYLYTVKSVLSKVSKNPKNSDFEYHVINKEDETKVIQAFKCINKAYELSNYLNIQSPIVKEVYVD